MNFYDMLRSNTLIETENGAKMYKTSGNPLVDLNFSVPKIKDAFITNDTDSIYEIWNLFSRSFKHHPVETMKWLLYLRDIRMGIGERNSFRHLFVSFAEAHPEIASEILKTGHLEEYGRWDDIIFIWDTTTHPMIKEAALQVIRTQFILDLENLNANKSVSLLGKWMPSGNTSSAATRVLAYKLRRAIAKDMTAKEYRISLSRLRSKIDIVEKKAASKQWGSIEYSSVPSLANIKYRKAFLAHDNERRSKYLDDLENGKNTIHANSMFLHNITTAYSSLEEEDATLEALWKAQDKPSGLKNTIVVRDGSGSMYGWSSPFVSPIEVANAISLYCAEHMESVAFRDKFITFSYRPEVVDLTGYNSLFDRLQYLEHFCDASNTNIEAVFTLILNTAKMMKLTNNELPDSILIISDMQFDALEDAEYAEDGPLMDILAKRFKDQGYILPKLIFWNVSSYGSIGVPMQINDNGILLLSGFSKTLLNAVLLGKDSPWEALVSQLNTERYAIIDTIIDSLVM